ncbi:MAG TPA: protoporphyrinogen oxidase [Candidatus Kapabacteria bacterium]|nr:protoporphyrinogen oxidase [Candidatus Kapabacteria bacterium]
MRTVAVVGGGITGLVTAYELQKAGAAVSLFEASDHVGGPIRSFHENGYLAEAGPNTLLETSTDISSLIEELGIASQQVYANAVSKKRFIVRNHKPIAVPTSPPTFISSPLFSLSAKLRLLREPFISKKKDGVDESLADFVRRRLGQEFLDYAIDPFVSGVYAGDPEKLSAKHAFAKVTALEEKYGSLIRGQIKGAKERKKSNTVSKDRAKMFSFDQGLQVLIDALVFQLKAVVNLQTPIDRIEQNQGWNLFSNMRSVGIFDAVVLTMPAYALSTLPVNGKQPLSSLSEIYYPPVTSLALGFRREDVAHPLDGFGMLIPKAEGYKILGTLFSSTLFPNRAPDGKVLLTTYIGGARNPEIALLGDEQLVEVVLNDLRDLLGVTGKPTYVHRTMFKKAIPQYNVGYQKYKNEMDDFEKSNPGLYLAGNFRTGISVSDCINAAIAFSKKLEKTA